MIRRRFRVLLMSGTIAASALGLAGGAAAQAPTDGQAATLLDGPAFQLVSGLTGKCATPVSNLDNAPLVESDCTGGNNQKWVTRVFQGPGTAVWLVNVASNLCLDYVTGANGITLKHHTCGPDLNQRWNLNANPFLPANVNIVSQNRSHGTFCMDLDSGSPVNGTKIQIWTCDVNNWNQLWLQL